MSLIKGWLADGGRPALEDVGSRSVSDAGQLPDNVGKLLLANKLGTTERWQTNTLEGFDPGSERTLAAWIRHASRGNPQQWGEPA